MSSEREIIYPRHVLTTSITWDQWVRLPISQIHNLRRGAGSAYYGSNQPVYFHRNWPIRYLCVTGVIISFEALHTKYLRFHVDDGSGRNIAVQLQRLPEEDVLSAPSNTTIPNMNISSTIGACNIYVDDIVIDVGTVVKLKCTLGNFFGEIQLELQRILIIQNTDDEIEEWANLTKWTQKVAKPWYLNAESLALIDLKFQNDTRVQQEKERQKIQWQQAQDVRYAQRNAKKETKRKELEEAMNSGALI